MLQNRLCITALLLLTIMTSHIAEAYVYIGAPIAEVREQKIAQTKTTEALFYNDLPLPTAIEDMAWNKYASPFKAQKGKALVAIVIDDVGMNRKQSARTIKDLPQDVTLAFLPYAPDIQDQVNVARKDGHEIMLHLPMQPKSEKVDPGPDHLKVGLSPEDLRRRITKNLNAFDGYAGLNNHMGSRFTQNQEGIDILMTEVKKRHLYFLDSRTVVDTVAEDSARAVSIPTTHRDVFLDDKNTQAFVLDALKTLEKVALKKGSAVAIGHPKSVTLKALKEWLPHMEEKGLQLAPLSAVIRHRQKAGEHLVAEADVSQKEALDDTSLSSAAKIPALKVMR